VTQIVEKEVIKEVIKEVPVTQIVEKEVIKYVDRPAAPVTHTHTHSGVHVGHGVTYDGGSTSSSYGSGSSYGSETSYGSDMADCPAGTTKQADGTCLEAAIGGAGAYSSGTTYSSGTSYSSGTTSGYSVSDTVVTPSSGGEYCYGDSGKRYDSLGKEISGVHGTKCRH